MTKNTRRVLVIMCILMAAWLIVMTAMMNFWLMGAYGWTGLVGGIIGFIISVVSVIMQDNEVSSRDTTEVSALPGIFTAAFLTADLVLNTVLCGLYFLNHRIFIPVALNLVLIVIFIAVRIFADPYKERVEETAAAVGEKVAPSVNFTALLSEISVIAADPEEKAAVRKLQELVSLSPNMSHEFNSQAEETFRQQLMEVKAMTENGADKALILREISEAEKTWRRRNGVSGSVM